MKTFLNVLLIILAVIAVVLIVLYFVGRKMQSRQAESQAAMEAAKQTVSMFILDKKKLKLSEAGLPKQVEEQSPKYMRRMKMPIVQAKVGPRIMNLMADPNVFEILPVKKEVKVVVSGIYIMELKSVRGGSIPKPEPKKGIAGLIDKARKKLQKNG